MTRPPHVSVVVPVFNAERTLAQAITSVLEQSFGDLELVVCDDASRDGTRDVVRSFKDKRVRLVQNAQNSGEGAARDHAISAAQGEWLAVLDADDAWQANRLEKLLGAVGKRRDCMVFDDLMICHDTPDGLVPWRPLRGSRAFGTTGPAAREIGFPEYLKSERLLIKPLIPSHLVRYSAIRHSDRRFGADSEYFIRLVHAGSGFLYLPEPLYLYRVTPGSATALAKAAHLMRDCIEACASLGWKDEEILRAFRYKIAALKDNELLYELAGRLKRIEPLQCLGLIVRNPRLLRLLPRRTSRHLAYQVHRLIHSGAGR